jgi:uncharacterized protein YjbJ (UPF0337 family)
MFDVNLVTSDPWFCPYAPECVEGLFCELRPKGVLRRPFCGHLGGPGCNLPGLLAYLILRTHEEERRQMDKAVGKAKEAYGAITGDEELKAEGRAEQRKADAEAEARQREKRRQAEAAARQAEKERDRQRLKDKGPLGGITDTTEDIGGLTDKLTGR